MPTSVDVLYYACGGGLGHVTRAGAILRKLPASAHVLAFADPPWPLLREHIPVTVCRGRTPRALGAEVAAALTLTPRVLVVDAFPDGVFGELAPLLPALHCPTVLIWRHLRAPYRDAAIAAAAHFDVVLQVEDGPAPLGAVACPPVLGYDAAELLPAAEARQRLGAPATGPVILAVGSADTAWTARLFALLRKAVPRAALGAHLCAVTPGPAPLLPCLPGAEVVVGAGGYNLFHETAAVGVPAIFLPQPRRFDDQHWRTRAARTADTPETLESALAAALAAPRPPVAYHNGADMVAAAIGELLR